MAAARKLSPDDAALVEWVRAKIRPMRERKPKAATWREIGELFGLTHAWAQGIMNPDGYGVKAIGQDAEQKIARKFFGGSVDAFRAAATGKSGSAPSVDAPTDDVARARVMFPRFATYERYADEHALAAMILHEVDRYPNMVAGALVHAGRIESFNESETPEIGLRAAQIAENARSKGKLPPGSKLLKKMPTERRP